MDIFDGRSARPMLIGLIGSPFDDADFLFELKLDGERVLAYADGQNTALVSRSGADVTSRFPELAGLGRSVNGRCILDGEIIVMNRDKPDYDAVKTRLQARTPFQAAAGARELAASFVAYDLLYRKGESLARLPLTDRLEQLTDTVRESENLSLSRTVVGQGIAFAAATRNMGLEGVVAKRKSSRYFFGKRSRDWIKIKNLLDDDFVICGYKAKPGSATASLVLGQYDLAGRLVFRGHVLIGTGREDFRIIAAGHPAPHSPFAEPIPQEDGITWLRPELVCRVGYLGLNPSGSMRHPSFKELRPDKHAAEARQLERAKS